MVNLHIPVKVQVGQRVRSCASEDPHGLLGQDSRQNAPSLVL
jgi:hypothetical protein